MSCVAADLLKVLQQVDRPGSFCVSGNLPPVLPGLEVRGLGTIGLPLGDAQAAELASRCHPAPYGKGECTIVDKRVRDVLELDTDRFALTNPAWPSLVDSTVQMVVAELGLQPQQLESHLYKLLLYEPGSFFVSHRDGERLDRMVATLVMVLPSAHEGGELLVRHDGQERTTDFGGPDSPFQMQFAAFYADCEHEIRPVRNGYRLCLVYNLTLVQAKRSKKSITAPEHGRKIHELHGILNRWRKSENGPEKLAITLDHEYTEKGLTFDTLKGVDRARARVLFEAARRAECRAYLALLTLWESGLGEDGGASYGGYGGRRRFYDELDDEGSGEYEMVEVYDDDLSAEHWSDLDGNPLSFGAIRIDEEDEVVSARPLRSIDPEEDFEGYTGNEGMTLERWYRHAAVIVWPAERHFDILCDAGTEQAVAGLGQMVLEWKRTRPAGRTAAKVQCVAFAAKILSRWPARPYVDGYRATDDDGGILPLLAELDEVSLVRTYLREVLAADATQDPGPELCSLCSTHGWLTFREELMHVIETTSNETIGRNVRLLENLTQSKEESPERRELCALLAARMMAAVERWDGERTDTDWRATKVDRSALLPCLVRALVADGEIDLLDTLVRHILEYSKEYPLTSVQMPALTELHPWLLRNMKEPATPLAHWLDVCREELESRAQRVPVEPADWRRSSELSCDCTDCSELADFLKAPSEQVHRFSVRKDRRRHLHEMIDRHRCDIDHVTERKGRPYTLVCTKNTASYLRSVASHQRDLDHLSEIRSMQTQLR